MHAKLEAAGAAVIGVSQDAQATSDRFCASLDLPFTLVGDAGGAILRAYQVRWPLIGLARRVSYVIGRDRRIRMAYRDDLNPEAHVSQVLESLGVP